MKAALGTEDDRVGHIGVLRVVKNVDIRSLLWYINIRIEWNTHRGIAQQVEQRSPKPRAEGSIPSAPAKKDSPGPQRSQGCLFRSMRRMERPSYDGRSFFMNVLVQGAFLLEK